MTAADFPLVSLTAKTHPPGYSFHKYWARKPHNVVRRAIEACGVGPGDVVIDPFCGSGVPLSEAAALGAICIGFDVNPIAVELTQAALHPPDPEFYRSAICDVLDDLEASLGNAFRIRGKTIRYSVHATIVNCLRCKIRVSSDEAVKRGRIYTCPRCTQRLYFNLEKLVATRIIKAVLHDGTQIALNEDSDDIANESNSSSPFNHLFFHNARILAFRGMQTRHLFTRRNFLVLTSFAERIATLPSEVQAAARLTLTAAVAQCSRLIAYRNDLTTGGPAWTVPGFWVPPLHIETNPLLHIRARIGRTYKGLKYLRALKGRGASHKIHQGDAVELIRSTIPAKTRAKVVFLDPPYGDSVPYLEFSAMWNSFLGCAPDPALDIAVSDRDRGDGTWEKYERDLIRIVGSLRSIVHPNGSLVVTFNNKDIRAWQALLTALQLAKYRCEGAFYQHPAVVSAKAQLAQNGSYVGDFYCVFRRSTERPSEDVTPVQRALDQALESHPDYQLDDEALQRVAMTEWLRRNIDAPSLRDLPRMLKDARIASSSLSNKEPSGNSFAHDALSTVAKMLAKEESVTLASVAAKLHQRRSHLGIPSTPRLKAVLESRFAIKAGMVVRRSEVTEEMPTLQDLNCSQLSIFKTIPSGLR